MLLTSTQDAIDELVNAFLGPDANARQRYLLEQNLQNLVRLAKTEQMHEIKANVQRLTRPVTTVTEPGKPRAFPRD